MFGGVGGAMAVEVAENNLTTVITGRREGANQTGGMNGGHQEGPALVPSSFAFPVP